MLFMGQDTQSLDPLTKQGASQQDAPGKKRERGGKGNGFFERNFSAIFQLWTKKPMR
jgi:hypothetical protein